MATGLLGRPDSFLGQVRLAVVPGGAQAGAATFAASATLAATGAVPLPAGRVEGGFSDGGHAWSNPNLAADYARAKSVNAQWVRTDWDWWAVQDTSAAQTPNWALFDGIVDLCDTLGLKVLPIIHSVPPWANGGLGNYAPPSPLSLWTTFAYQAALRYIPRGLTTWEVGNEPNLDHAGWTVDGGYYVVNMLVPIVAGLRQAAAELGTPIQIIFGSLSPTKDNPATANVTNFVTAAYNAGAQSQFDLMGVHPYTGTNSPLTAEQMNSEIVALRSLMVGKADGHKHMWATEYGWATSGPFSATEAQLAQLATEAATRWSSYGYTGPLIWYSIRDRQTYAANTGDREDYFGAWRNDGTPKTGVTESIGSAFGVGVVTAAPTTLAATSSLTAAGVRSQSGATSLQSSATLTAAGSATARAVATLPATAALTSTGTAGRVGVATLTAAASLATAGTGTGVAAATLAASATLTAAATRGVPAAAALTAAAALAPTGLVTTAPSVVIVSDSSMTATAAAITTSGAAALSAASALTPAAFGTARAAATLAASANLVSAGAPSATGAAALTAAASLTAAGRRTSTGAAALTALASLTTAVSRTAVAAADLSAQSTLVTSSLVTTEPSAVIGADAVLTCAGFAVVGSAAQLAANAALIADTSGATVGTVLPMVADTDLFVVPLVVADVSAILVADADFAAGGAVTAAAEVGLLAESVLTPDAGTSSAVALDATSDLLVDGARALPDAAVTLVALSGLSARWDRARVVRPSRGLVLRP